MYVLSLTKRARPLACQETSLSDWETPVLTRDTAFGNPAVRSSHGPVALRPHLIPRNPCSLGSLWDGTERWPFRGNILTSETY